MRKWIGFGIAAVVVIALLGNGDKESKSTTSPSSDHVTETSRQHELRNERHRPQADPAPVEEASASCHPSYDPCLAPSAVDYDCAGGSGDGPEYTGYVTVKGPDDYDLDSDGDGTGCES